MANYAFMQPIEEGKTDEWQRLVKEMKTNRNAAHKDSRRRAGLKREEVWLQQTPMGDFAVVYWEADNIEKVFESFMMSDDPHDRWFREKILEGVHGMDPSEGAPPLNQKVFG